MKIFSIHSDNRTAKILYLKSDIFLFQEAEEMHLKAISIKEKLLGPEDYEVALSVGHLASIYNYDMDKFDKAEKLYLRSIAIGKKVIQNIY